MNGILLAALLIGIFCIAGGVYGKKQEEQGWGWLLAIGLWLMFGSTVILAKQFALATM